VGLVQRDRDGVDPEEVCRHQYRVGGVVGGQLGQARHRRQCGGIGGGGRFLLGGRHGAVGSSLHQPCQIGGVGGHVGLGARAVPRAGPHRAQQCDEVVGG